MKRLDERTGRVSEEGMAPRVVARSASGVPEIRPSLGNDAEPNVNHVEAGEDEQEEEGALARVTEQDRQVDDVEEDHLPHSKRGE